MRARLVYSDPLVRVTVDSVVLVNLFRRGMWRSRCQLVLLVFGQRILRMLSDGRNFNGGKVNQTLDLSDLMAMLSLSIKRG